MWLSQRPLYKYQKGDTKRFKKLFRQPNSNYFCLKLSLYLNIKTIVANTFKNVEYNRCEDMKASTCASDNVPLSPHEYLSRGLSSTLSGSSPACVASAPSGSGAAWGSLSGLATWSGRESGASTCAGWWLSRCRTPQHASELTKYTVSQTTSLLLEIFLMQLGSTYLDESKYK